MLWWLAVDVHLANTLGQLQQALMAEAQPGADMLLHGLSSRLELRRPVPALVGIEGAVELRRTARPRAWFRCRAGTSEGSQLT